MDHGTLRALALSINLQVHGVSVTVTRPSLAAITTRGIWLVPRDEDRPYGTDFQRREPRRLMVLPKSAVATMPRGTAIVAAELEGGDARNWVVDGLDSTDVDHWRVILVPGAA